MAHCGQHIFEMQLFHELKQKYSNIPDYIITHCIKKIRGEKKECRCILDAEHWFNNMAGCTEQCSDAVQVPIAKCSDSPVTSPVRPDKQLVDRLSELVLQTALPTCKKIDIDQLIKRQLERKQRLERELVKEKETLKTLKQSIRSMKHELRHTKAQILRLDISRLSYECQKLTDEVDVLSTNSSVHVPLGETNEEFYQNVYPGQHFKRKSKQNPSRHRSRRHEDNHWVCHVCTLRNHPMLNKCESCDMPRIHHESTQSPNIRIHVRHHNYPCKVVHSWVL